MLCCVGNSLSLYTCGARAAAEKVEEIMRDAYIHFKANEDALIALLTNEDKLRLVTGRRCNDYIDVGMIGLQHDQASRVSPLSRANSHASHAQAISNLAFRTSQPSKLMRCPARASTRCPRPPSTQRPQKKTTCAPELDAVLVVNLLTSVVALWCVYADRCTSVSTLSGQYE